MIHTKQEDYIYLEINDDILNVSVFLSSYADEEDLNFIEGIVNDYSNTDYEVGIDLKFELSKLLDQLIDNYKIINEKDKLILDLECKPIFDKTREELVKLIEIIDGLKFKGYK
mgnify:CR=1 FL=1